MLVIAIISCLQALSPYMLAADRIYMQLAFLSIEAPQCDFIRVETKDRSCAVVGYERTDREKGQIKALWKFESGKLERFVESSTTSGEKWKVFRSAYGGLRRTMSVSFLSNFEMSMFVAGSEFPREYRASVFQIPREPGRYVLVKVDRNFEFKGFRRGHLW